MVLLKKRESSTYMYVAYLNRQNDNLNWSNKYPNQNVKKTRYAPPKHLPLLTINLI